MSALLLSLSLLAAAEDPRIQLVELQAKNESRVELAQVDRLLVEDPEWSGEMGLHYLRGRLLDRLDRPREATRAYTEASRTNPQLQALSFLRIAILQTGFDHPELAAGALAAILRQPSSQTVADTAGMLFVRSLAQGGDCRLLKGLSLDAVSKKTRRRLLVAQIDCDLRAGRRDQVAPSLLDLIEEGERDLAAKQAADRLVRFRIVPDDLAVYTRLGTVFHQHRDFEAAVVYLEPVVRELQPTLGKVESDLYYKLVRSHFWNASFDRAAEGYGDLAERSQRSDQQARALYQQGRSYELMGRWSQASRSFRQAFVADREGEFAGSSLLSALRIEWRVGREKSIDDILELLLSERSFLRQRSRAMLFLASSDIVRSRSDRAGQWLSHANSGGSDGIETAYWRGRLAELLGDDPLAVRHYLNALRRDAYHPLSVAALERLRSSRLQEANLEEARRLSKSDRLRDLVVSLRILGSTGTEGQTTRARLEERLRSGRVSRTFLDLKLVPTSDWPLWQAPHEALEEKLLGLGLWSEGSSVVLRHFPLDNIELAFTASRHLSEAGRTERSLYIAEVLSNGVPSDLPAFLLPTPFRTLVYPLAYQGEIAKATDRFHVDPYLLLAILRQESRFDPMATSPASARGLGQFIFPTAARIARQIGRSALAPEDLEDPAISIELSGAYMAELGAEFRGSPHRIAAAYNAGELQSKLWDTYCYSWEPEEFYTKVSFGETRGYLESVLRNRAHYLEIYGPWQGSQ